MTGTSPFDLPLRTKRTSAPTMPTSSASSRAANRPNPRRQPHAADRDIPGRRPDILGATALVDQRAPVAPSHHDEHARCRNRRHARGLGEGADDTVLVVHDIDQLSAAALGVTGRA